MPEMHKRRNLEKVVMAVKNGETRSDDPTATEVEALNHAVRISDSAVVLTWRLDESILDASRLYDCSLV